MVFKKMLRYNKTMSTLARRLSTRASSLKSDTLLKGEQLKLQRQQKSLEKLQAKQEAQQKAMEEQQRRTQQKAEEQKKRKRDETLKQMEPLFNQLLNTLKSHLAWQSAATSNLKSALKPGSPQAVAIQRADSNIDRLSRELATFQAKSTSAKADEFQNLGVLVDSVLSSNTAVNNLLKSIRMPLEEQKTDLERQVAETVAKMKLLNEQIQQAAQKLKEVKAISDTRGKLLSLKQKL